MLMRKKVNNDVSKDSKVVVDGNNGVVGIKGFSDKNVSGLSGTKKWS